jgi:hypothetical protein
MSKGAAIFIENELARDAKHLKVGITVEGQFPVGGP